MAAVIVLPPMYVPVKAIKTGKCSTAKRLCGYNGCLVTVVTRGFTVRKIVSPPLVTILGKSASNKIECSTHTQASNNH